MTDQDDEFHDGAHGPSVSLRPVGYVQSDYDEPSETPIQSLRNPEAVARIEFFPEFVGALDGLAGFDYAWILSWLDRDPPPHDRWRSVPFLLSHLGEQVGAFASRHPARPNPLGLSLVRLIAVKDCSVTFRGVDLCRGTPVLDVKPWQQDLDIPGYREGWDAVREIRGGWYTGTGAIDSDQILPGGSGPARA